MDYGGLGYQKRTGGRRALRIILYPELGVNMILGRSGPSDGSKDDTMREGQSADLDRGEESRSFDRRSHRFLQSSFFEI